jgi:hypothetical protein
MRYNVGHIRKQKQNNSLINISDNIQPNNVSKHVVDF